MYLADMVRGDLFNPKSGTSLIEKYFNRVGGTYWPNAFTPSPDTPRSTACLFSGNNVADNGVRLRSLSLLDSFGQDQISLFKSLHDNGIKNAIWRERIEIDQGIWLPGDSLDSVEQFSNRKDLFAWMTGKEDLFVYRHDNTYHQVMDQLPLIRNPHKVGLNLVFKNYLETVNLTDWDAIWFISDHGCILPKEPKEPKEMLNRNRTNIPLFLWTKSNVKLELKTSLQSITDLYPAIHHQFNLKIKNQVSGKNLLLNEFHEVIWMDDYGNFYPVDNELPNVYAERTIDKVTIFYENQFQFKLDGDSEWKTAENRRCELINKMIAHFPFFEVVYSAAKRRYTINSSYNNKLDESGAFTVTGLRISTIIINQFKKYLYKILFSIRLQVDARKFSKGLK
jgi:hypothetical protein